MISKSSKIKRMKACLYIYVSPAPAPAIAPPPPMEVGIPPPIWMIGEERIAFTGLTSHGTVIKSKYYKAVNLFYYKTRNTKNNTD